MNKVITTLFLFAIAFSVGNAQVYLEDFDELTSEQTYVSPGYESSLADGEWTITGDGTSGQYTIFGYHPVDGDGNLTTLDIAGNNKIYVRAKASSLGTQLRMDVRDADGFATTIPGITKFLIADYSVFEFDFTGVYQDGGYGGTSCDGGSAPCAVDGSRITDFQFYINPGVGAFAGTLVIDFLAVGSEPQVGPMSEVFQDHFDDTTTLRFISSASAGLVNSIEDSQWKIRGDGTNGMWDPVSMLTFNPATLDTVDISVKNGEDKVYLRMRSTIDGTSIRLDLQDINNFATTAGSITKIISSEFETYEFNFAGSYQDLAYGGTGCDVGPCDVDSDRIANMILFVNPGVEAFAGEVDIEYISVGTALEINENEDVLVYGDHFPLVSSDYVATSGVYELNVSESILSITGNGEDAPFSNIGYTPHDENGPILVDATGNDKVFIRARSTAPNTLLRVDLIDSSNYATTTPSFTRLLEEDFTVLELNFDNNYFDAGYGGSACDEGTGPCPVDGSVVRTLLLYPNPADGGFAGTIEIDYISFGAPLGDDVADVFKYADQFDDGDRSQFSDAVGFTVEELEGELIITGDGTAGAYSSFSYVPHNQENLAPYVLDVTSNNKIFVKAKSSMAGVPLRIDLIDENGYATTEPSTAVNIGEEYSVLEFDFTGTYNDAAYGGTGCTMGPCAVDGTTISSFLIYIDPVNGGFNGTVTLDWFSTIDPLDADTTDLGPLGIDDYADEFSANDVSFFTGNNGLLLTAENGIVKVIGDGTSGQYDPIGYTLNDGTDQVIVNTVSNDDKIFIRAKSTVEGLPLRLDLQDNLNYHTSLAGLTMNVTSEFSVIEYNFAGNYKDGGYGGTACTLGPCDVDGQRVANLNFYPDPGVGAFNGELHFDWISFGEPISVSVFNTNITNAAKLYPNPSRGELYLEMDSKISGKTSVIITDISGRIVSKQSLGKYTIGNNSNKINVNSLSPGLYIISVNVDDKIAFNQKVIIK